MKIPYGPAAVLDELYLNLCHWETGKTRYDADARVRIPAFYIRIHTVTSDDWMLSESFLGLTKTRLFEMSI